MELTLRLNLSAQSALNSPGPQSIRSLQHYHEDYNNVVVLIGLLINCEANI